MILLFSGEGPTDIGGCQNGQDRCNGADVEAGPMLLLANQLAEAECNRSFLEAGACAYVSERALEQHPLNRKRVFLPGKRKRQDTGYYYKNARALAQIATEMAEGKGYPVAGILFRDADGTRSASRTHREDKVASMYAGFDAEGFPYGVPMMPKPKSEVWLLFALQSHPYQNCSRLESISGNDKGKHPAKKRLDEALAAMGKTKADVCDLIRDGQIQATRICMPSFNEFRERFQEVIRAMCSRLNTVTDWA